MKRFLKNIISFIVIFLLMSLFTHLCWDLFNRSFYKHEPSSIYVFGDSQLFRSLRIDQKDYSFKMLSSSKHGAGIYDFLNFTKRVPENSSIILQLPKLILMRPKNLDRNDSGLLLSNIYLMWNNGYSIRDLWVITSKNFFPNRKWFHRNHDSYPCSTDLVNVEENRIKKIFSKLPNYFYDKENLFLEGISILNKKNVKINFIELPFHPELDSILYNSDVHLPIKESMESILNSSNKSLSIKTLELNNPSFYFHDWTHLNYCGASLVTPFVLSNLETNKYTFFRIIN
jgi:hypothetical protein